MPGITGVEFLETIKSESPMSVRMLLTGFADISAVMDAINKGEVYRYLTKPWDEPYLKRTIDDGVELHRLRVKNDFKTNGLMKVNKQLEFLARQNLIS
jgi:response regulator RpfG family c-di-GMP phosphodiesterase